MQPNQLTYLSQLLAQQRQEPNPEQPGPNFSPISLLAQIQADINKTLGGQASFLQYNGAGQYNLEQGVPQMPAAAGVDNQGVLSGIMQQFMSFLQQKPQMLQQLQAAQTQLTAQTGLPQMLQQPSQQQQQPPRIQVQLGKVEQVQASGKRKGSKPSPFGIKKPKNPFLLFKQDVLPELKESYKDTKYEDLFKKAGEMWQTLAPEKKAVYEQQFREAQAIYRQQVEEEKLKQSGQGVISGCGVAPIQKSIRPAQGAGVQGASNKKKSDPERKQYTSFFLFTEQKKAEYLKENPKMPQKDVVRLAGQEWGRLSQEQKLFFKAKAQELNNLKTNQTNLLEKGQTQIGFQIRHFKKGETTTAVAEVKTQEKGEENEQKVKFGQQMQENKL